MKKLLILVFVLVMGPAARAGLSLVDLGGGSFGIEGPAGANYTWYLGVSEELHARRGVFTDLVVSSLSHLDYYGVMDWAVIGLPSVGLADTWAVAIASTPGEPTVAGVHATFETGAAGFVQWGVPGVPGVYLLDPDTGEIASALYVPEPLAAGLLCLGSLFLRRRR